MLSLTDKFFGFSEGERVDTSCLASLTGKFDIANEDLDDSKFFGSDNGSTITNNTYLDRRETA